MDALLAAQLRFARTLALLVAAAAIAASLAGPVAAQTKRKVAVLQFTLGPGVSVERETFSSSLQNAALKAVPSLSVMTQANILSMVRAQGKTLDQCEGECAVETGRLLGADFIVAGRISKIGKKLHLSMQLYSSASGQLLGGEDLDAADEEVLLSAALAAAPRLFAPLSSGEPAESRSAALSPQPALGDAGKTGGASPRPRRWGTRGSSCASLPRATPSGSRPRAGAV
jgi:TolB-like protein